MTLAIWCIAVIAGVAVLFALLALFEPPKGR